MIVFHIVKNISIACFMLTLLFIIIAAIGVRLPKVNKNIRDKIFDIAFKIGLAFCLCGSISLFMLPIIYIGTCI